MLSPPEKVSLLTRVKELSYSGAFLALLFLAMAGWVYLLSSLFLKFVLWCFS
jgi:NADH:ubiquinone oxidoreductase subunit 6 (subunit J)